MSLKKMLLFVLAVTTVVATMQIFVDASWPNDGAAVGVASASSTTAHSQPMLFPARQFVSKFRVGVYIIDDDGNFEDLVITRSGEPFDIPACRLWGVEPLNFYSPECAAVIAEMKQQQVPGLILTVPVTDEDLQSLAPSLDFIQWLDISDAAITNDGMKHLQGLKGLRRLDIDKTCVGDAGLKYLSAMTELQSLSLNSTDVTDAGLEQLKGLGQLREISLDKTGVADKGLAILAGMKGLRRLSLESLPITDAGVEQLLRLKEMQGINLDFVRSVTSDVLDILVRFKDLDELRICGVGQISNSGVIDLSKLNSDAMNLSKLTSLKKFCGNGFPYFEDENYDAASAFWRNFSKLHELYDAPKEISVLRQVGQFRDLKILSLSDSGVGDDGLKELTGLKKMRKLVLSSNLVTDAGLENLKGMTEMRCLYLDGTGLTGVGIEHLKGMTELRELDLSDARMLTDEGLAKLGMFTKLQRLSFSVSLIGMDVGGTCMASLQKLKNLRSLDIGGRFFITSSNVGLNQLSPFEDLQELDIGGTMPADLKNFPSFKLLKILKLNDNPISDDDLKVLQGLTCLQELDLARTKITDDGLEYLKDLRCMRSIDLAGTGVVGDGLKHLVNMKGLREINLCKCQLVDDAWEILKTMKNLHVLHTTAAKDSPGLNMLQKNLPGLSIYVY